LPVLPRIWIITDPDHPDGPVDPIRRALVGCAPGRVGVQLRAKRASDRQLVAWGKDLRELTSQAGAPLTINRRPDVAQIVAADGVHLPERGLQPDEVSRHWPGIGLIGVSRHTGAGLRKAEERGASYAFLSPVFEVPGKGSPMGIEGFSQAIEGVGIPTFALGGLSREHIAELMRAGAWGIAVRRAIYASSEPDEALGGLVRELDKSARGGE
jgi:thiamine-phosphate pyrophosphorylase